jgi:phosphomannomutase
MRVLQDYLFGAAGREMLVAFPLAGAVLEPLHFTPDGAFPLGDPNPVKGEVIREGLQRLGEGEFHLAHFFDGDGDRLDVYHGDGTYVASSFVYAAMLPEIRQSFPGQDMGVFADLKSNPLALIEMARAGVTVDVIRNGPSQFKQSLLMDPRRFGAVEESAHFYEAFSLQENERYCSENSLYTALLAARVWCEDPGRVRRMLEIQGTTIRAREWGYKFPGDRQRAEALQAVREHFESLGARSMTRMKNGMELEATLMRRGLPFDIGPQTALADGWLQICQRISQSEDRLARWEVVGADESLVRQAKREIAACVARFGAGGEYQG